MYAKADLSLLEPTYRSKTEDRWAREGGAQLEALLGIKPVWTQYEPFSIRIPGGRYTPDFFYIFEDGRMGFVEVKASKHQRSYRSSRAKLRAAAETYPFFIWVEARPLGDTWELEVINARV